VCVCVRVSHLYVLLRDQPGSVRQQLVEGLQAAQLGGHVGQARQPALVAARLQVGGGVLLQQVGTLMPRRRLQTPNPATHHKQQSG